MKDAVIEDFIALTPVNFFQFQINCNWVEPGFPKLQGASLRKNSLPDLSALCDEFSFAQVAMGWNPEGIEVYVNVGQPFRKSSFPDVMRGDSVELFFDTRDVKTSGFNTRFCHHFFFLAESIEGHCAGELTRFRTEDAHDLCDPQQLKVKPTLKNSSYTLQIFIPNQCLHGYDPAQFDRLGFTYRINRSHGSAQHFSVVSDDYQIDQQPSLWSSMRLVK